MRRINFIVLLIFLVTFYPDSAFSQLTKEETQELQALSRKVLDGGDLSSDEMLRFRELTFSYVQLSEKERDELKTLQDKLLSGSDLSKEELSRFAELEEKDIKARNEEIARDLKKSIDVDYLEDPREKALKKLSNEGDWDKVLKKVIDKRIEENENAAVASLATLVSCCKDYKTKTNVFPSDLGVIADEYRDSVDVMLASGDSRGYHFVYKSSGAAFFISAHPVYPGSSGNRSFFTDQSADIYCSAPGRFDADVVNIEDGVKNGDLVLL